MILESTGGYKSEYTEHIYSHKPIPEVMGCDNCVPVTGDLMISNRNNKGVRS